VSVGHAYGEAFSYVHVLGWKDVSEDLLAKAARDGVLVVSPATIAINLNLLTIGLQALQISERAEQIQRNLRRLSTALTEIEESWTTLYRHIRNAYSKAGQVDSRYNRLKAIVEGITQEQEES